MFKLIMTVIICFLVIASIAEAQVSSKSNTTIDRTQNITPYQPRDKESAELMHLSATYRVDEIQYGVTGLPEFIRGDLTPPSGGGDPVQTAYAFFEDNAGLFTMKNPRQELRVTQTETDEFGMTHVTFLQYADGVPVFTGDWKAHLSADGRLRSLNGEYHSGIAIRLQPVVSASTAETAVRSHLNAGREEIRFRGPAELWVYPHEGTYDLTWHIIVDGPQYEAWRYFVNALDGRVIHRITLVKPEESPTSPGGGMPRNSSSDTEVLEDLSMHALEGSSTQIVFGREGTWVRHEGEYAFQPATVITDFDAAATQLRAGLHERAAGDWRDFVLDLRAPGALETAQGYGLALEPLPEPGYYRTHTNKQMVNNLSAIGIDAADYPYLPAQRTGENVPDDKRDVAPNPLDEILFNMNFEGIFPPAGWSVGDANSTNGDDFWDDVFCNYHNGSWSGWCAATGDMPDCVNYDDYMTSYMLTPALDVWGRSHLSFNYWWRNVSENGYDFFRTYVSLDAVNWVEMHSHSGNSPAWSPQNNSIFIIGGGDWLFFRIEFTTDFSVHGYEGAYVDDIQLLGDWASCGFTGIGVGMMGQWFNHIDDTWNGSTYILEDKSRVTDPWGQNCQHGHQGLMGNDQRIVSWNQTNLVHFTDADNTWSAPTGVDNMVYQTALYDFLRIQLNRNSYNNAGSSMYGVVNGTSCTDNAFGGGQTILFCQPSAGRRGTGGAPDVVGHEWGHSITVTESNLIYERESGALDESWCDILGSSFGFHTGYDANWLIGDFTFTNGGAWRDMANPAQYTDPECYLGQFWWACDPTSCPTPSQGNDFCGVHTNSGVPNRMYTLLVNGGTLNNVTVDGIGLLNALRVVYVANRDYWTQNTNMAGGRAGCISAANAINPSWVTSVTNAWAAVCVGAPVETPLNCNGAVQLTSGVPYFGWTNEGEGHVLNYNCTTWNESGRERVHWISLAQPATITVTLSNLSVDLDVFLLSDCDDDACVAYGNTSLSYNAAAQIYWVVVDGYNGVNGQYTLTYCATPPATVLGTPSEGALVCSGASQVYTWNLVPNASDYNIQWDDNAGFTSPEEQTVSTNSTNRTLVGSGTWYWRVRGVSTCAVGPWSETRSIALTPAPIAPTPGMPSDGAMVCSGAVQQYTWNSVPTAFNYSIQWDDNSAFSSPLEQSTGETSYSLTLIGSGTWYWRVRALSVCGYGPWSATRTIALTPVPAAPTLTNPADGALVCSGAVQNYAWNAVPTAYYYYVQWDDNPGFATPLEQSTSNTYINLTLVGSGTWYWRARAQSVCGDGSWSTARSFVLTVTPGAASLINPVEGAPVCSGVSQSYSWNAIAGATNYTVQWDDNSGFSSPVEQGIAATNVNQILIGGGTWYWRVRGNNICGNGTWSANRTINLISLPTPPAPVSPVNGASVCSGIAQTYVWNAVAGATSYQVQWDDNAGFSSPVEQTTTNPSIAQGLVGSGTWYWRVRATNSCGNSDWAPAWTIVLTAAPGQVTLVNPADGASLCSGTASTYQWNALAGSNSYTIQWDDNSSFSSPLEQSTAATSISYTLTGAGTWYWRVRGVNVCGNGTWSVTRSVNLISVPVAPSLSTPADGATVCSGALQTYTWGAVPTATSYTIQWDDQNNFASPLEQTVAANSAAQILNGSGTWYWRVRATNSCGAGSWSTTRTVVLSPVPAVPALSSPPDGTNLCSGSSQTYSWSAVAFALSYTIQWDDNSGFGSPLEQSVAGLSVDRTLSGSGTWYWRVRASNACGAGGWSTVRTVTVTPVPSQTLLVSPLEGANVGSGVPQSYVWNSVAWAALYTIQWDDNTGFTSPIEQTTAGTSFTQSIVGGGTWYWRVQASNACGAGVWSAVRSFILGILEPPVVVIVPEGTAIRLAWPPVAGATSYRVEYSNVSESGFSLLTSTPDTTITQPVSASDVRFYRVIAEQ